ncbi:MAG TPA: dihydrolipoamide acetyltransferase family protein [Solirubrobacteraceae bacterium]|nr:dihydrolipoamide acetyltransferase family protein [Solirubrobacteraceae bacterium]
MAGEIIMPRLYDSMEEGTIRQWLVAEGDRVEAHQPLVEIETGSDTVTYEADDAGTVLALTVSPGGTVPVGAPIAVLGEPGEQAAPPNHVGKPAAASIGRGSSVSAKGQASIYELTRAQRTVARRTAESRATVPDFELRCEVDMSGVIELRKRLTETTDTALTYSDFIVKAVALALRDFPRVNAAYRDGAVESYARINIGIAVAAQDALVVPTIFDADRLSVGEISRRAADLAVRARDGSITPAELAGGTFTVSNLGTYGVDSFSAVINPPQAAILAVGSVKSRPVVLDDERLTSRPTVHLTLSCDNRVLYGADAARFLDRLRELLERRSEALLL